MFQCWWAKRNLNTSGNVCKVINWFQNKMMFCTIFSTLLWFLAHKLILYIQLNFQNKKGKKIRKMEIKQVFLLFSKCKRMVSEYFSKIEEA
jgi:hypothetical protein